MSENRRPRGPMGGHGRGAIPGEKAKDFKGSMKKIFRYMERYRFRFAVMFVFAIGGDDFQYCRAENSGKGDDGAF